MEKSPYLGKFALEDRPAHIGGETSPMVLKDKEGTPYTVTMNSNNMQSLEDKYGAVIHEMREDMINFHKGLYDGLNQEAYQYMVDLDEALKNKNIFKVLKLLPKYKKMDRQLKAALVKKYMSDDEIEMIESAYRTPQSPMIKNSEELNEIIAENTRHRSIISRRNNDAVGDELDRIIENMSDDDILDVLSSGKSYGQDYRAYIEENPKERAQMISNIKRALIKVGVFTGVAANLPKVYGANDDEIN